MGITKISSEQNNCHNDFQHKHVTRQTWRTYVYVNHLQTDYHITDSDRDESWVFICKGDFLHSCIANCIRVKDHHWYTSHLVQRPPLVVCTTLALDIFWKRRVLELWGVCCRFQKQRPQKLFFSFGKMIYFNVGLCNFEVGFVWGKF